MSTEISRVYDFVTDRDAGTKIQAARIDGEFDPIIASLNKKVQIKSSAPSAEDGVTWVDISEDPPVLKVYDGTNTAWVEVSMSGVDAVSLYRGTNQTHNSGQATWDKVEVDNESFDVTGIGDESTNKRVDVAKVGKYLAVGMITISNISNSAKIGCSIYVNGASVATAFTNSGAGDGGSVSANVVVLLNLAVNDYIELYAYQNDSSSETIIGGIDDTYLNVMRVSQ
jgi:hypothetical protein